MAKKIKTRKQRAYEILLAIWAKVSSLKVIYGVVAIIIAMALLVLFYNLYWEIYLLEWGKSATDSEAKPNQTNVQNLALAFLGVTSGFAALFGGYLAILKSEENKRQSDAAESQSKAAHEQNEIANKQNDITNEQNEIANKQNETTNKQNEIANEQNKIANRQANTAEQGIITDRINRATEGLGKNDGKGAVVEVRLGALYAMERIAKDSERDHVQIMEILCAYIRHNSPLIDENKDGTALLREDIQAALTIIGRREKWPNGKKRIEEELKQDFKINLSHCYLYGAKFSRANLNNAWFIGSNLKDTWFNQTSIDNAMFNGATLNHVWLEARTMNITQFNSTTMIGVHTQTGDFSKCTNLTQEQLDQMFCGSEVIIPDTLRRPLHWPTKGDYNSFDDFLNIYYIWKRKLSSPLVNPQLPKPNDQTT